MVLAGARWMIQHVDSELDLLQHVSAAFLVSSPESGPDALEGSLVSLIFNRRGASIDVTGNGDLVLVDGWP